MTPTTQTAPKKQIKIIRSNPEKPAIWFNKMVGMTVGVLEEFDDPYPGYKCDIANGSGYIPKEFTQMLWGKKTGAGNKKPDGRGKKAKISDKEIKAAFAKGLRPPQIAEKAGLKQAGIRIRMKKLGLTWDDLRYIPRGVTRMLKSFAIGKVTNERIEEIFEKTGLAKGHVVDAAVEMYYQQWKKEVKET
jgi:hypothetical protein